MEARSLLLASLLALAAPAQAVLPALPQYRIVTVNEKVMILMDFATRAGAGQSVMRARTALYYRTPQAFETGSGSATLDYVLNTADYDCAKPGRLQLLSTHGFASGNTTPMYEAGNEEGWGQATPGTMGMKNWDAAYNGVPEEFDYMARTGDGGHDHDRNLATYRTFIEQDWPR